MKRRSAIGVLAAAAWGQAQDSDLIRVDVQRVVLYATVREGKARFVGDLAKDDFRVLDNGKPQEVLSFSKDDVPVAIGILVDNSASMMNKREEVVAAAKAFVRATKPSDELFVLHFNETLQFGLPKGVAFSGDHAELGAALEKMVLDGRTALYDAIHLGLRQLNESKLTKKALVVISDGGDNTSVRKQAEVIRQADLSGALFYGIGIYDPNDGDANPGVIRKLAQNTGGESYFPESAKEVTALCETIARELRSQYMISYAPPAPKVPGEYRKIELKVKNPAGRKLLVRARTGYFAGGQEKGKEQP